MHKYLLTLFVHVGLFSTALADNKLSNDSIHFSFFSPMNSEFTDISESSFSVPHPIIVLDPLVLGNIEEHPGKSVIQQISADQYTIRVSGTVYDFIADMVANRQADIHQVSLVSESMGTIAVVPVKALNPDEQNTIEPHPMADRFTPSMFRAMRPYPFAGRFESEPITLPISSGYNGIFAKAVNVNQGYSVAGIRINAKVNREKMRYDIEAKLRNLIYINLVNPVLVYIEDPKVNKDNVDKVHASINGTKVGLRYIDGQLQLDRPIMGISRTPPERIPNLVEVTGEPDNFVIQYRNAEAVFNWSYTR